MLVQLHPMNSEASTQATMLDELVIRVANDRDREAFSQLFRAVAPRIRSYCLSGHPFLAEVVDELVQEVMWKVWKKAPTFDIDKASFSTWLFAIARNTRIDWLRQQEKHQKVKLKAEEIWHETTTGDHPFLSLQQKRNKQKIQSLVNQLPEKQLQVISKIFLEGKTHAEVAEEMDMPLGTVKSRLRLALNKLKSLTTE